MAAALSNFHHLEFMVANANQSAYWFCCSLGFRRFARKETEKIVSIAVKNKEIKLIFTSRKDYMPEEKDFYVKHGDTVVDVAFLLDDMDSVLKILVSHGVEPIEAPKTFTDGTGRIKIAKIRSQESDVFHSLIERDDKFLPFLPGFEEVEEFIICKSLGNIPFERIDHVVQAYPTDSIDDTFEWSVDDLLAGSEGTSLSAYMLTNEDRKIQYLAAESAKGRAQKSQIQEFVQFNGGSGIQHMALLVDDIIQNVVDMKDRSVEFLQIPESYYELLAERLSASNLVHSEDLELLKNHRILMDFDEEGYLLQIFTKPLQDRPTMFIELIQRQNFNGFGAGNFKTLFKALENEQKKRGTL